MSIVLWNGVSMPVLGLGTYRLREKEVLREVVTEAIRVGYRCFDTAAVYRNEKALGEILREVIADPSYGVKREDLFIVSKLAPKDQGYGPCKKAFYDSLSKLDLDYIDLYLIHWPGTQKVPPTSPINQERRLESYQALIDLYRTTAQLRAIGVSNYTPDHLAPLLKLYKPHVLQVEMHPLYPQSALRRLCARDGIVITAYGSLGEGRLISAYTSTHNTHRNTNHTPIPDQVFKVLEDVAQKHHKSVAQILLKWGVEHGVAVIPKASSAERVRENAACMDDWTLGKDREAMDRLVDLCEMKFAWDPAGIV